MSAKNPGYSIRTAEEECDLYPETRERMDADRDFEENRAVYAGVEIAYATATPDARARTLRDFINGGANMGAQMGRRDFADALACYAGFSDNEIRRLQHLRDGQSPRAGWHGVPAPLKPFGDLNDALQGRD